MLPLAASQTESVALSREFAQLRAYLDIMALRMGPRLSFRLDYDERILSSSDDTSPEDTFTLLEVASLFE